MSKFPGDIAEIKFHLTAHERGYLLLSPLRPTRYDFAVDTGKKIVRVQVKSTSCFVRDSYRVDVRWKGKNQVKQRYAPDQIDFIVAYVHTLDAWYIIPIKEVKGANLLLYPHKPESQGKMEKFKGAWNLLET